MMPASRNRKSHRATNPDNMILRLLLLLQRHFPHVTTTAHFCRYATEIPYCIILLELDYLRGSGFSFSLFNDDLSWEFLTGSSVKYLLSIIPDCILYDDRAYRAVFPSKAEARIVKSGVGAAFKELSEFL
jgi:hypothetical protein